MNENNTPLSTPQLFDLESEVAANGYQILECIGAGGTATVYKAKHVSTGRIVAIKVLEQIPTMNMEKISSEAKLLSRLNHPSICQIYSINQSPAGVVYFVMEWIDGLSLTDFLTQGQLSDSAFELVMRQVLEAVRYAHAEGILHRDLKPDNVMVLRNAEDSTSDVRIKIIDFGLARTLDGEERNVIHTQSLSGSPAYMSPEQCKQERGDERSDIYSLGVIMYQCMSSARPFEGDSAMEVMYSHLNETVPPLQTTSAKLSALRPVVMRCLAKAPEQRYQNMSELLEAFERALTQTRRAASLPGRPRTFLLAAMIALIITIGFTSIKLMERVRPDLGQTPPVARAHRTVSTKNQFLQATSGKLSASESLKSLNEVLNSSESQFRMLALSELIIHSDDRKERTRMAGALVKDIALTKDMDDYLATHHLWRLNESAARLEDDNMLDERHNVLVALSNAHFLNENHEFRRDTYKQLFRNYCSNNQQTLAEQALQQAMKTGNGEDSLLYTRMLDTEIAISAEYRGDYKKAEQFYTKATARDPAESVHTIRKELLLPAASFFMRHGQLDRAEKMYVMMLDKTAYDDRESVVGKSGPAIDRSWYRVYRPYARSLLDAGLLLNERQLIRKALKQCKLCLELKDLTDASRATIYELQAQAFLALSNVSEAKASIELAAKHGAYEKRTFLETRLSKSKDNYIKGEIELRLNHVERARDHFKRAILKSRSLEMDARDPCLHDALRDATELLQPGDLPAQTIVAAKKALAIKADGFQW